MGKYYEYFLVVSFPERQLLKRCGRKWTWSLANLGFPHSSVGKDPPVTQETRVWFWVGKIHWRRDSLPIPIFLGFAFASAGKESACHEGDLGLIPRLRRSPEERKGYPLQYSGLENSMDSMGLQRVGHDWATFTLTFGHEGQHLLCLAGEK